VLDQPTSCQRAARDDGAPGCPVRTGPDGSWQVSQYDAVRAVLRSTDTRQAGFAIEYEDTLPKRMKPPVLWRDGPEHREHRRRTARFFTERRVEGHYRDIMRTSAEKQVARLRARGSADLASMSFAAAVEVVGKVIGLPGRPGMARRLERFFTDPRAKATQSKLAAAWAGANSLVTLGGFYLLDVRPAIRSRRRAPQDDLVSHLVGEGARNGDVFGECMTFAAAGMITTREFITLAAWYLFSDDDLRDRWTAGDRAGREAILHELLRLEPVVSALHRVTTADVPLPDGTVLPAGARVDAMLVSANRDPAVAGDDAGAVRPGRPVGSGLAFGDGPHKCPGAHVAVQESEIFLSTLFAVPGLRMVGPPAVRFRKEIEAYELTGLRVAVG
jgi:cytochrome P450